MAVKTARINTVSFSYSNVAKNWLVCKPGDILTLVEWAGGQMYVDLATPESLIWGICDDKKVFSETNETKELDRVNYTPIAWDNTYKMEVSWEGTPKVGFFYTMTDDQKIDLSTESNSVGQFMVQDINDAYIEVRFVVNQGLAVPQYEDVKLESIEETNPDSDPFDGLYTFTLSNGTQISGDFSALAWYLWDVTITGDLTVQKGITATENITTEGDVGWANVTASGTVSGNAVESTTSITAETATINGALQAGDATLEDITASTITTSGDATVGWKVLATGDVQTQADLKSAWALNVGTDATIAGDATVQGDSRIEWNEVIVGTETIGGNTTISWTLWVASAAHFSDSVDIDEDLNVDGSSHIAGSQTIDGVETVNDSFVLWPNATAPQFILQAEKNAANGVAALDANGKISDSVLPPLAIGETFVVSSEADMLALTAQRGDICVRTDISKTYIKLNNDNPSTMADWQLFYTSGEVISVNGQTGTVVLDADDIDDTTTTNKFVTAADKTTWNNKQNAIGYTPENQALKDQVSLVNSSDHYPSSSLLATLLGQKQDSLWFVPENVANKDTATLVDSTTHYPSSHVLHDQLATKQDTLVSGTNIKTINNQSILGSGNILVGPKFYYETTNQGAASYQLGHTPISDSSIIVFTDSWTVLFPTTDYTCVNGLITFTNLWSTESAIIWVVSNE